MADGYIESKFADYEKRKAEWERKKRLGLIKKSKPNSNNQNNDKK